MSCFSSYRNYIKTKNIFTYLFLYFIFCGYLKIKWNNFIVLRYMGLNPWCPYKGMSNSRTASLSSLDKYDICEWSSLATFWTLEQKKEAEAWTGQHLPLLGLTTRDLEDGPAMSQGNTHGWWTVRGSILSSRHWNAFGFFFCFFFKGVKYTQNELQSAGKKPFIRAEPSQW